MAPPLSALNLVKWSTETAEAMGKPESAKFIYDWVKATGGAIPSPDELTRLGRAVEQGFNTVGFRYSANPSRDEAHLQKMLFEPKRLADENRAFHVDITPRAPAANMRFTNVHHDAENEALRARQIRPLALKLENLISGSDEQANSTRFLTEALNRKATGVRYTPTEGELAGPAHDIESPFFDLAKRSNSAYQPSVAMIDPTAVRDLRTAKFQNLSRPALMAAVAAGATPLLKAEEPRSGSIQATPQSPMLGAMARAMMSGREVADKVNLPIVGGLGSLLMGKSPEEVEAWSYGDAPMRVPQMTNVPQFKRGRADSLMDTVFAAQGVGQLGRLGKAIASVPGVTAGGKTAQRGVLNMGGDISEQEVSSILNKLSTSKYVLLVNELGGKDPYKVRDRLELLKALEAVEPALSARLMSPKETQISAMLENAKGRFVPPRSASEMHDLVTQSSRRADDVRTKAQDLSGVRLESGAEPSYENTKRAFEQGYTLPGYRVVPYGDASIIHPQASTPGAHFAPVGREEQLVDILNKYKEEGLDTFKPEFKPRMSIVYSNPEGLVRVDDSAAEHAHALASRLGLTAELRNSKGYGANTAPRLIEDIASRNGVNSLLYKNIFEGVGGEPSALFKGVENPSVSILKQRNIREGSNFAKGGSVDTPDPREHKPYVRGVNPLQSVARGWVAGTAGLPGDIEGLARLLAKYAGANVDQTPTLPTTEFYREWLPGKQSGAGEEVEGLGSMLGGVGVNKFTRPLDVAVRAAAHNAMIPGKLNKQAGVVKVSSDAVEKLKSKMLAALKPIEGVDASIFEALKEGEKAPSGLSSLTRHYNNSIDIPTFPYPVYHGATDVHRSGLKPYSADGDDVTSWLGERRDPRNLAYATVDPQIASNYSYGIYDSSTHPTLHAYVGQNLPRLYTGSFSKEIDDDFFKSLTRLDYEELAKTLGIFDNRLKHAEPWVLKDVVKRRLSQDIKGITHPNYDKLFEKINSVRGEHIATLPENYIQVMNDLAGFSKSGKPIQKRMPQVMLTNPELAISREQLIPLKGNYAKGGAVDLTKAENQRDPYTAQRGGPNELTKQYPAVSGFLQSLLGSAPDEMGSVLDPLTARRRAGAEYGFPVGTAAQLTPGLGPLSKLAASGARAGARNLAVPPQLSRQAGVIKAPFGQWLSGSVEGALGGLKSGAKRAAQIAEEQGIPVNKNAPEYVLEDWIDKQLTRYVKNDMATERDPIRALAERGVLHVARDSLGYVDDLVYPMRIDAGYAGKGSGTSELAKAWEDISDMKVKPTTARKIVGNERWMPAELDPRIAENPWLLKVPPETPAHELRGSEVNLGFTHLIDELRNATNPESGLPAELLLKYSSLPQVSVPQAVERVAKINEWRAAKALESKKAAAEGIPVMKEYPEGYKWLSVPDVLSDEKALKYAVDTGCEGGWCTQGPDTAKHYGGGSGGRLHILQGPDGSAHVQIHIQPQQSYGTEHLEKFRKQAQEDALVSGVNPGTPDDPSAAFLGAVNRRMEELAKQNLPLRITQIKGKSNRAPNEEYLPFVQDFVKSGKWSDVGDLENARLVDIKRYPKRQEALGSRYVTDDELNRYLNQFGDDSRPNMEPGFAAGGIVATSGSGYNPERVEQILTQLRAELQ